MKDTHTPALQALGVNPTNVGLRGRCDHCHLLHRPCRNGTTTTPCDRCREGGVLCKFSPHGSVVDKHVPGRRVRTGIGNCGSLVIGKFINSCVSCISFVNANSHAATPNKSNSSPAKRKADVDDGRISDTVVKVAASHEHTPEKPKPHNSWDKRFIFFTQNQINSVEYASMHPGESLEARQKLAYKLMDMHEWEVAVEMKEREREE